VQRVLPRWATPLFLATVAIPTLLATLYFGFIASDVYVSESRYIVRSQGKQAPTGLASLLAGGDAGSLGGGGGAMNALADYAISRDAMQALDKNGRLTAAFTRPEIDLFNRLVPVIGPLTREDVFDYYTDHVAVSLESQSAITTLVVKAYRPEDAQYLNARLLELGEALVNRLNERSRTDLVRYARQEVEDAKREARNAAFSLAAFRNRQAVIDPEKQANVSLQMISKLQDEVIQTRTQLVQTRAFTPANPQIPVLQSRIASLDRQIDEEMSKIAGGKGSLAAKSAEYTRLSVEAEYADKLLTNALISLQNANNDARRQQAYVERIVLPNRPDEAREPRRLRSILSVFALGLAAWGVLSLLFSAMREHDL
jgi:capsular polysaccharide transport system permease protein